MLRACLPAEPEERKREGEGERKKSRERERERRARGILTTKWPVFNALDPHLDRPPGRVVRAPIA